MSLFGSPFRLLPDDFRFPLEHLFRIDCMRACRFIRDPTDRAGLSGPIVDGKLWLGVGVRRRD
jgi:hypothetical protein